MIKKLPYFKFKFIILAATFVYLNCGLVVSNKTNVPRHDLQNVFSELDSDDEEEFSPIKPETPDEAFDRRQEVLR